MDPLYPTIHNTNHTNLETPRLLLGPRLLRLDLLLQPALRQVPVAEPLLALLLLQHQLGVVLFMFVFLLLVVVVRWW